MPVWAEMLVVLITDSTPGIGTTVRYLGQWLLRRRLPVLACFWCVEGPGGS
jgi:hypothetical protein